MAAGKIVDLYGLHPGLQLEQADAKAAYTQAKLKGIHPWLRLPLARYGHLDAGTYWKQHADKHFAEQRAL